MLPLKTLSANAMNNNPFRSCRQGCYKILLYHFVRSPYTSMAEAEEKEGGEAVVMYAIRTNQSGENSCATRPQRHHEDPFRIAS